MKLPVLSGSQCIKALQRAGFSMVRTHSRNTSAQRELIGVAHAQHARQFMPDHLLGVPDL